MEHSFIALTELFIDCLVNIIVIVPNFTTVKYSIAVRTILLTIPDQHYSFIKELVSSIDYLQVTETGIDDPIPTAAEFAEGMRSAVAEVKEIKAGKKKGKSLEQFLNEL